MKSRPIQLIALLLFSGALLGCPDTGGPKLPTAPKVPQPKVDDALARLVMAPAIYSFARRTT